MSLTVRNTLELIDPAKYKAKILLIAPPGFGKTEFIGGIPNVGIAACEPGKYKGLTTIADKGLSFVTPDTASELESVCKGIIFKDKDVLALDSVTAMVKSFIRKSALTVPRKKGDSEKRRRGIPELDDYGTMGVMTYDLLLQLLELDKHVVATAQLKIQLPDAETGKGEYLIGPDLPGQMFLGAPAMFDIVLIGKTRQVLKEFEGGIKKKVPERYWITAPDGVHIAKCRTKRLGNLPLLDPIEVYDLDKNTGTWDHLYAKIRASYEKIFSEAQKGAQNAQTQSPV